MLFALFSLAKSIVCLDEKGVGGVVGSRLPASNREKQTEGGRYASEQDADPCRTLNVALTRKFQKCSCCCVGL